MKSSLVKELPRRSVRTERLAQEANGDGSPLTEIAVNPTPIYAFSYSPDGSGVLVANRESSSELITITPHLTGLVVETLEGEVLDIPPLLVAQFVSGALHIAARRKSETTIRSSPEGLTLLQLSAIQALGVRAVYSGTFKLIEPVSDNTEENKQKRWNEKYKIAIGIIAGDPEYSKDANTKDHELWLEAVDILLEYALVEEAKHGLDETKDLFEAVRVQCIGALSTLPRDENEKPADPDPRFLVKFAGCLARLSSCTSLRDYDRSNEGMHPLTEGRSRNDDLYNRAIRMYQEAERLFGGNASEGEKFLVISGLAHAEALRDEYIIARSNQEDETSATVIDIKELRKHRAAIQELEQAMARTPTYRAKIERQIEDTRRLKLFHDPSEGEELHNTADILLHDLVAAA